VHGDDGPRSVVPSAPGARTKHDMAIGVQAASLRANTSTDGPLVEVERLSRIYASGVEEIRAVDDVDLCMETGRIVLIQGKSGSGKTTLLNLIGGLDVPSAGRVSFRGRDLSAMSRREMARLHRREIGFVFQAFALMPGLTACENVDLPLRIAGCRPREAEVRALRCLEQVGLAKRAHHRTEELSGGEQQRVAIARGLVGQPRLLLADEPTGDLDHAMAVRILGLFREIVESTGTTICLTSHDPVVADYAHRVYTMEDGKLDEERERR
jgi:putative ABC transport system ATP-binding protein